MIESLALPDRHIVEALRRNGYKATPQRIAICRYAIHRRDHPSAKKIYEEVRKQYPSVSLATIYNTIGVLKRLHMLQELPIVNGDTRFDPNMEAHINLVCLQCGSVRDFDGRVIEDMVTRVARTARFDVRGQSITVYGVCQDCDSKKGA